MPPWILHSKTQCWLRSKTAIFNLLIQGGFAHQKCYARVQPGHRVTAHCRGVGSLPATGCQASSCRDTLIAQHSHQYLIALCPTSPLSLQSSTQSLQPLRRICFALRIFCLCPLFLEQEATLWLQPASWQLWWEARQMQLMKLWCISHKKSEKSHEEDTLWHQTTTPTFPRNCREKTDAASPAGNVRRHMMTQM